MGRFYSLVLNILEKCDKYYLDILHPQSRIWSQN
jgi:hypothetical protein